MREGRIDFDCRRISDNGSAFIHLGGHDAGYAGIDTSGIGFHKEKLRR